MESMKIEFIFNKEQTLPENTKRLVKLASLSALEFYTDESITETIGHQYTLNGVSILGTPSFVNICLKELSQKFISHIKEYLEGDDSFEEKMCQIDETLLIFQEFRISNEAYSYFLLDIPDYFLLHTQDQKSIEVTLNQININTGNCIDIINEHLNVRNRHILMIEKNISINQQKFITELQRHKIDNPDSNPQKTLELMEVWIGLDESGFLDYIPSNERGVIKPLIRKKMFELFNLTDINYKKLRAQLMERKNSSPEYLNKLVDSFTAAIPKKVK
jgi:hypothetical protein